MKEQGAFMTRLEVRAWKKEWLVHLDNIGVDDILSS